MVVQSELVYVYIISMTAMLLGPGSTARIQDGIPTSYMDTDFVFLVHEGSVIWTGQLLQVGLTAAPTQLEFVYILFQQRSDRWRWPRQHLCGLSNTNVSFKQQSSASVAALAGP